MKETQYTSYDQLPLTLSVPEISQALGISLAGAYELVRSIHIGLNQALQQAKERGVLPMFCLELTSGLRRGELLAPLWTDLDVEKRIITVSKSMSRVNGEPVVSRPRCSKPRRPRWAACWRTPCRMKVARSLSRRRGFIPFERAG